MRYGGCKGATFSQLSVALYCGLSARLSEQYGAGRAAFTSKAFHAVLAEADDAGKLMARLYDHERATVAEWHRPTDIEVAGVTLAYKDAVKEQPIGLRDDGSHCDPSEPCLTAGTPDLHWVRVIDGRRVVFVGDFKKSRFAVASPDNLQNHAAAIALCSKHGAAAWCVGLWYLEDGEWDWHPELHEVGSFEHAMLLEQIQIAATNKDEASLGGHCLDCWHRTKCPEYLLPATLKDTELAAMTHANPSNDELLELLSAIKRWESLAAEAKECVKAHVRERGPIANPHTGKAYKLSTVQGKERVDLKVLKSDFPEVAAKVVSRGMPYERPYWGKLS